MWPGSGRLLPAGVLLLQAYNHLSAPEESCRAGDEEGWADGDSGGRDGRGGIFGPRPEQVLPVGFELTGGTWHTWKEAHWLPYVVKDNTKKVLWKQQHCVRTN